MKPLLLILALVASLFVNSQQEDPFLPGIAERVQAMSDRITLQKANDLAFDYAAHYPPGSHTAKLNYRLVPPLLARLVGCDGLRAIEFAAFLTLGACIFWSLARVVPARVACAATLATLCTSSGAVYHNDLGHCCDVLAQALLALCLLWSSPWLLGIAAFLAMFTDERAVLILPLLGLLHGRRAWPLLVGVAGYGVCRLALGLFLYGPTNYADVACLDYALAGLRLLPAVIWGCLEGAWLVLAVACAWLWRRDRQAAVLLAAWPVAVCCLSLAVLDLSRSASYGLLTVPVAVLLACRHWLPERRLAWACYVGAALSVLCPNSQFITGFIEMWK